MRFLLLSKIGVQDWVANGPTFVEVIKPRVIRHLFSCSFGNAKDDHARSETYPTWCKKQISLTKPNVYFIGREKAVV